MNKKIKKSEQSFPYWFDPKKPPELPIAIQKAVEKHESRSKQWKYILERWETVEREKRRLQYEKLKAEFENPQIDE